MSISVQRYSELGELKLKWLHARYHFSFAHYHNPDRMSFGKIRVINDDIIQPHSGFDPHPHSNMEIITYVRQGAITHTDSEGNSGRTEAGNVQVMSAGTGITHSEYNHEDTETILYQIWIEPRENDLNPSWSSAQFPTQLNTTELPLLVSGKPEHQSLDCLKINQDASIYGGKIKNGATIIHPIQGLAYLLVSKGTIQLDKTNLDQGDSAEISDMASISVLAVENSEIVLIDTSS